VEGIPTVTVQGNIHCRNKAIISFGKECSVILLGLGTAASGTNLTAATHVILVDPMNGTPKEVCYPLYFFDPLRSTICR
jgi:hypothetical protein